MKKASKLVVTSAILAAGLALAPEAQADTVDQVVAPNPTTEAAPTVTPEVTPEVVAAQETQVDIAKTELEAAEADLATATASLEATQADAAQASPEGMAQAQAAVASQEKAQADAQAAQTRAQEQLTTATEPKAAAQTKAEAATKAVATAQSDVNTAQAELAQAQARVDDSTGAAKEAVVAAQDKVTAAQTDLTQAQNELVDAQVADKKRSEDIAAAKSKLTEAQAQATKAQEELAALQGRVDNSFTNLADYANALINNTKLADFRERDNDPVLLAAADAAYAANNYVSSKDDQARTVEVNKLTPEVRQELNLFALSLVNDVRQAVGAKPALLSQNMMDYADKLSDIVVELNKERQHNSHQDRETKEKYNLDSYGFESSGHNEVSAHTAKDSIKPGLLPSQKTMTVDAMKEWIYNTYKGIFFKASRTTTDTSTTDLTRYFAEALFHSGLNHLEYLDGIPTYIAVDFSSTDYWNNIHPVLLNSGAYNFSEIKYDVKNFVEIKDPNANAAAQATEAEKKLAAARTQVADAERVLAAAEAIFEQVPNASHTVATRQRLLDEAKQALVAAERALATSGTVSAADLEALKAAKDKLAEKEAVLAAATKAESTAKDELTKVNEAISAAQATLTAAQTALATATKDLATAQARLESLKNYPQALKAAEEALATAKAVAAGKAQAYQEAVAKLEALKALLPKPVVVSKPATPSKPGQAVAVTPLAKPATVSGKVSATPSPAGKAVAAAPASTGRRSAAKALPNTGDTSSLLALLGLNSLGLAGLLGRRRR